MAEIHPYALSSYGGWGAHARASSPLNFRRWADLVVDDEGDDLEEIERAALNPSIEAGRGRLMREVRTIFDDDDRA
jgi:hypothetical protein